MYAWFIKDKNPGYVMFRLFQNAGCNLNQYWKMGHSGLYFRYVKTAAPLYNGGGTLVCDTPFDTWLFPKGDRQEGKPQFDWKPFTIAINGAGKAEGHAWMGVHKILSQKMRLNIPKLKEMHGNEQQIRIAT